MAVTSMANSSIRDFHESTILSLALMVRHLTRASMSLLLGGVGAQPRWAVVVVLAGIVLTFLGSHRVVGLRLSRL